MFDVPRYLPDIDYKSVRPFHPPSMDNWQKLTKAKTMADLLDTDSEMFEPPLTIGIPLDQLKAQADQGDVLKFPQLPCHSQSVEGSYSWSPKLVQKSGRTKEGTTKYCANYTIGN